MATTEQLMQQYGVAWFTFDEDSGVITDKLASNYIGTPYNINRTQGWNGKGNSVNFIRASNSRIIFNNKVIPTGDITLRFKIFFNSKPTIENQEIISNAYATATTAGLRVWLDTDGQFVFTSTYKANRKYSFSLYDNPEYGRWYDYIFSWDTINKKAYLYRDEELVAQSDTESNNSITPTYNLTLGKQALSTQNRYFNGKLDDLQVYNTVLEPSNFTKMRMYFETSDKKIVLLDDTIRELPNSEENTILQYGEVIKEIYFATDYPAMSLEKTYSKYQLIDSNGSGSVVPINPITIKDFSNGTIKILILIDDKNSKDKLLNISANPFSQLVYAKGDIDLVGVEKINSLNLLGSGNAKVALSFDRGLTYIAYRNSSWVEVGDAHDGMTFAEINSLTTEQIELARGDRMSVRFSYSLADGSEIDNLQIKASLQGTEELAKSSVYDISYNQSTAMITYTIKKTGTYTVNYVDS